MQDVIFKKKHHDHDEEASHDHSHEHSHGGGVSHSHSHTDGDHEHSHGIQPISDERANALLDYMISHNRSHTQELREFAATLEAGGKSEASAHIVGAAKMFAVGTASLEAAKIKLGGST
jgi:ABC-type Zn2+ transport system substrate-binding protein/surface adhesin